MDENHLLKIFKIYNYLDENINLRYQFDVIKVEFVRQFAWMFARFLSWIISHCQGEYKPCLSVCCFILAAQSVNALNVGKHDKCVMLEQSKLLTLWLKFTESCSRRSPPICCLVAWLHCGYYPLLQQVRHKWDLVVLFIASLRL